MLRFFACIFLISLSLQGNLAEASVASDLAKENKEVAVMGYVNKQPVCDADSDVKKKEETHSKVRPLLEFKAGYFFFSESKMRKIYDHGGLDVQLSGSYPIWRWLQVYGSVEYLQRSGRTLKAHQKTSIWEVPLSLGLKPVITICPKLQYYFTLGPRYFFVHQHNHSSHLKKEVSRNGCGGFVNTGFAIYPLKHMVIDIFGEYSYKRMHFHSYSHNVYGENVQIGGFTFGLGVGYAF